MGKRSHRKEPREIWNLGGKGLLSEREEEGKKGLWKEADKKRRSHVWYVASCNGNGIRTVLPFIDIEGC